MATTQPPAGPAGPGARPPRPPPPGQRVQITPEIAQQMAAKMRQQQQQQQMSAPPPPPISPAEVDFVEQPVRAKGSRVHVDSSAASNPPNASGKASDAPVASEKLQSVCNDINYLINKLEQHPEYAVPPPPTIMKPHRSQQFTKSKEDGNAKFKEGKLDDAIQLFSAAVDLAADRPPWESHVLAREELSLALSNRSLCFHNKGDFEKSLSDANAVVEIKKAWSKGHFRKGKALIALDKLQEARDAILLGLDFEPSNDDLKNALTEVDTKIISNHHAKQQHNKL
ncbi:hypothetical protein E3P92_01713 [Wallemia ichthyophaga]|uniref:Uncharacterized protein n=1 Tax=Wallemia ichthyophaga TaxID=245174 RepID=A0A4T0L7A7_WALIC|nr:hypothetical protein E3P91_01219 [Wallemia ichthyophaga]TIA83314.1 hypothetical protein E3P98_00906 [Wallemia ichthyophaga]TIA92282.1 hypothetical protein E3P97_01525 [Wallemia ichthyophaga]TIA99596.1 hypothetical protein E3P95_01974 [Wallemia ichthyophaga]TIB00579.1 hypothetical protein E3P94_02098 [Wallemia ichthyophaga]